MTAYPLDHTHDTTAYGWPTGAEDPQTDFPIQNLPYCSFAVGMEPFRLGVGIGRMIFDITAAAEAGFFPDGLEAELAACRSPRLNDLMALGPATWRRLRHALFDLLSLATLGQKRTDMAATCLFPMAAATFDLPVTIGDYTDFYASIDHATNVGAMFRPDNPLLPNYKWVPIGYHGRASSVRVADTVRRPHGQTKRPDDAEPSYGPCRQLDWELELGFFVGTGNALGQPIPIAGAHQHLFGASLLNDWSARDMQAWEYQPLGPFLAKSFLTTLSPWVVTMDALAPFRVPARPRAAGDPAPLAYLADANDQAAGGFGIDVTVELRSAAMRAKGEEFDTIATTDFSQMYWTPAQMLAHHASNGCDLRTGDLLGSGTISTADPAAVGSLLELTKRGQAPITLSSGETRSFLADGDEVRMTGRAVRDGYRAIGFGAARSIVVG
jgi:fumarylacetoacetase